jgi:hypothetical protein
MAADLSLIRVNDEVEKVLWACHLESEPAVETNGVLVVDLGQCYKTFFNQFTNFFTKLECLLD